MDPDFAFDAPGLARALELLRDPPPAAPWRAPEALPEHGIGALALEALAPVILGGAARLGAPQAFAHMDPPTPWIAWAVSLWNAALNQNLLHSVTSPAAREVEARVIAWLAPWFGMSGGHTTAGSTLANITALWAARDLAGCRTVVASAAAHLSVAKAAKLLDLPLRVVPVDVLDRLRPDALGDVADACLVLTAGTTSVGAVDPLDLCGRARWTHVDAAWAGPMRFSERGRDVLAGLEAADSVAVSAHKWLFQPKDSAFVLFRDAEAAHEAVSFGGGSLAAPNIGLLGSSAARAAPLAATLLAWGRRGLAERIDRCLTLAERAADAVESRPELELFARPACGVLAWRSRGIGLTDALALAPEGMVSETAARGGRWLRFVAANPNADLAAVTEFIHRVADAGAAGAGS